MNDDDDGWENTMVMEVSVIVILALVVVVVAATAMVISFHLAILSRISNRPYDSAISLEMLASVSMAVGSIGQMNLHFGCAFDHCVCCHSRFRLAHPSSPC